ncbi:IclR family transcriptional regulator [Mahella australiensis]|uniref:Transcriptional regulator, IclR family n=1 Tax=Mahella australiensis (strain DSM 15567 / CIP 107919 / 50-1 BON) TaxID=697281 RepID=F3ZX74_MAHA5|nr:IclR family transcriptional regulator [Mahella australiensis]AEE96531.1 transcriptional regulator, IclR family [Mahella australiensis 50-1 BON]
MPKKYAAPAVKKLLDIIELLSRESRGYSINEIARILDIPVNSVYRICKEMEERGYLEKYNDSGLYQLGSRFFIIGQIVGSRIDLRAKALPIMETLRDALNETVHLCVLQEKWMVLLDQVESKQPIRIHVETGSLMHAHASAFGKCLLANCPQDVLNSIIGEKLASLTSNTITDAGILMAELEKIRENGWAYDMEEYMEGVRCVGAPVFGSGGRGVAAIGIMSPAFRFPKERMDEALPLVLKAANDLSIAMGYDNGQHSAGSR